MQINIPRQFRLDSVPATITLSDEDVKSLARDYPTQVSMTERTATFKFESPRAAADFVDSLDGQIPYSARDMSDEDAEIFESPATGSVAREIVGTKAGHLGGADKVARSWGIAAFSVAVPAAVIAVTAMVFSALALFN